AKISQEIKKLSTCLNFFSASTGAGFSRFLNKKYSVIRIHVTFLSMHARVLQSSKKSNFITADFAAFLPHVPTVKEAMEGKRSATVSYFVRVRNYWYNYCVPDTPGDLLAEY